MCNLAAWATDSRDARRRRRRSLSAGALGARSLRRRRRGRRGRRARSRVLASWDEAVGGALGGVVRRVRRPHRRRRRAPPRRHAGRHRRAARARRRSSSPRSRSCRSSGTSRRSRCRRRAAAPPARARARTRGCARSPVTECRAAKPVVLIVIDGLTPSMLEATDTPGAPLPARPRQLPPRRLDLPVADAGLPRSIATGAHPDVHGIPHLVWWNRGERRLVEYGSSFAALRAAGSCRALRDTVVEPERAASLARAPRRSSRRSRTPG